MTWFIGRSIVVIALAFALGLVVSWMWWRRRKAQFAAATATRQTIAPSDAPSDAPSTTSPASVSADAAPAGPEAAPADGGEPATSEAGPGSAVAAEAAPAEAAPAEAGTAGAAPAEAAPVAAAPDATAGLPVVPTDPAPEQYEAHATPVEDIPTGGISLQDVMAAQAAVEARRNRTPDTEETAVAAPAETGPDEPEAPAASHVIDVTDPAQDVVDVTGPVESSDEDDLERVEGIGPRIGAALRNAGIHTFRELADADTATLQGALEKAGLRFAPSLPTWSRQARFLAEGDEDGFTALRQQLVGGGRGTSRVK